MCSLNSAIISPLIKLVSTLLIVELVRLTMSYISYII